MRYAKDSRIIFDLGLNNGDDTDFYLKRGFDVIALDANPALCERAQERFQAAINEGRLKILNAAIWDTCGQTTFYINLSNDHWSSLDVTWAARNSSNYNEITVECVTLDNLFNEFGVPYYLKVDVEGVDQSVIEQLRGCSVLPLFVSVEDCRLGFDYIRILASCGYNGFKLLDQSGRFTNERHSHCPCFPGRIVRTIRQRSSGAWLPYDAMVAHYALTVRDHSGNRLAPRTQWWDIHCTSLG